MRKIESLFISISLFAVVIGAGIAIWSYTNNNVDRHQFRFPETKYGAFLAAQHAMYVNDFDTTMRLVDGFKDVDYPIVQKTVYIAQFLSGNMPENASDLKKDKSMPAQFIYDAWLVQNDNWKELHNRHKNDESALAAPLRIWSAIANDWRKNTFKFIDELPTNKSWKAFVRGQIYAEIGDVQSAAEQFNSVEPEFMNINDYMYIMSFLGHNGLTDDADRLKKEFTSRPGGMFMMGYDDFPDWSVYSGYKNQLAFSFVQNVSHTQVMMYSDLAILMLQFAQITAPQFAASTQATDYYIGNFMYNNSGDWAKYFDQINTDSPFFLFGVLRGAEKTKNMNELRSALDKNPLFVPGVNAMVGHYVKTGDKRGALRVINRALGHEKLNDVGHAFFMKSRAYVNFAFGDLDAAQNDLRTASDVLMMDAEILSLQAKIWAAQNRELENAYDYAMALVQQNPSDILAWDTLGYVVAAREGTMAALEIFERVGAVAETCSSLFLHLGDVYADMGNFDKARDAYMRAIELADDGLIVVPDVERKIRKIK